MATLLLVWGADRLAQVGAQVLVGRNLADATGVREPPKVDVGRGLFLPQVIRGAYDEVDVTMRGIRSGPLRIDQVDAVLTDVRVPFHDVLVRDFGEIGVVEARSLVRLTYADLNAYFEQTGRSLRIAADSDGRVQLGGFVDVLGRTIDASATVTISAANGALRVSPERVDIGSSLDSASRLLLLQRLTVTIPLGSLPFGQQVTTVTATQNALLVETLGFGVVLRS